jgi:hypothetical protein
VARSTSELSPLGRFVFRKYMSTTIPRRSSAPRHSAQGHVPTASSRSASRPSL